MVLESYLMYLYQMLKYGDWNDTYTHLHKKKFLEIERIIQHLHAPAPNTYTNPCNIGQATLLHMSNQINLWNNQTTSPLVYYKE